MHLTCWREVGGGGKVGVLGHLWLYPVLRLALERLHSGNNSESEGKWKKKKSKRQSRQALASGRDIQGLRESQYLKIELGNARLLVGQEPQRSHENSVGCKLVLEVIFKCND